MTEFEAPVHEDALAEDLEPAGLAPRPTRPVPTPEERSAWIASHRWLATLVARRHARPGLDVEELEAEGVLGLVLAARRYDPTRGVSFAGYARHWVKAMILRRVEREIGPLSADGSRSTRLLSQSLARERRWRILGGMDADDATVAEALGVPREQVQAYDRARRAVAVPLDDSDDGGLAPAQTIPDPDAADPEEACARAEAARLVGAWLDRFEAELRDDRERFIWKARLRSADPVTLAEIGRRYGVSRQRIAQVEREILKRYHRWAARVPPPVEAAALA